MLNKMVKEANGKKHILICCLWETLMALVDVEAEVIGYCVWPIGSFKQPIYSVLIGQLSGIPHSN